MPVWVVVIVVVIAAAAVAIALIVAHARRRTPGLTFAPGVAGSRHALAAHPRVRRASTPASTPPEAAVELSMRSRISAMKAVVGALFGALAVRLWGMQLLGSDEYAAKAESNRTREVSTRAPRGRILDRNGNVLVGNRSSMALVATADVASDVRVVRRISNLLGMPEVAVRRNIQSTTEGAQSQRTIMIDVPDVAVAYVVEHPAQFPGVSVESRSVRQYPYGTLGAHMLGYTGSVTSDELATFSADASNHVQYVSGDVVGKTGVELEYESVLQGVRGVRTVHVDADGSVTGIVSEVPPEQGSDVRLTIDLHIQQAAEAAIQTGMECARFLNYAPTGGAVVVLDATTGEVLAMASYPSYDPTQFIGGISTSLWEQLQSEEANTPLLNRAINGMYPPASTAKPLVTLAGLEHGLTSYDEVFYCPGYWTGLGEAYGMWCWNHDGHKDISLHSGIANSCDAVFYEIAKRVAYSDDPTALQEMYRRWGLGSETGVDLPGEYKGRVPDPDWKWNWYTWADDEARTWQPGDTANIAIGQGDMLVTPMQLAYAYAGVANGGVQMRPHVMDAVLSAKTGDVLAQTSPEVARQVSVNADDLSFVHGAMRGVLDETVLGSYFAGLPVAVIGKSGTAEAGDDPVNTHAWFVAAAPAEAPQYVVASIIEHGGGGGDVTTSVCRQVLGQIYGVEMTDPISLLVQNNVAKNTGDGSVSD